MVQRTLAQINKERNYATSCWQLLTLKTIPYKARMAALDKEADILSKMTEKQLAKVEREKINYKESELRSFLSDPNSGLNVKNPTIISDRNEDTRY